MTDLTIDDATLNASELLLGVRYTDAERAQMRDNLAEQIELAVRRQAVKLPNARCRPPRYSTHGFEASECRLNPR
jgi:hypothetical protein